MPPPPTSKAEVSWVVNLSSMTLAGSCEGPRFKSASFQLWCHSYETLALSLSSHKSTRVSGKNFHWRAALSIHICLSEVKTSKDFATYSSCVVQWSRHLIAFSDTGWLLWGFPGSNPNLGIVYELHPSSMSFGWDVKFMVPCISV
jgi:hypothetical protein